MEKRKILLLKYLANKCSDGYSVLEVPKILSAIKRYKGNLLKLEEDINYFKGLNYIDVKYMDKDSVCLSMLDNSRILQANIKNETSIKRMFKVYLFFTMVLSGLMAFIGSFVAKLILG